MIHRVDKPNSLYSGASSSKSCKEVKHTIVFPESAKVVDMPQKYHRIIEDNVIDEKRLLTLKPKSLINISKKNREMYLICT